MNKRYIGKQVEGLVCENRISKGYRLLHQNWTCRYGEIDLVLTHENKIIFVEVKYRSCKILFPEEIINKKKIIAQKRAINSYLHAYKQDACSWQLDYAFVFKAGEKLYLQYFEQVPL